jgi:hypothetical protein
MTKKEQYFIKKNYKTMSDKKMGEILGKSRGTIKNFRQENKMSKPLNFFNPQSTNNKDGFRKFLSTAKTEKEIFNKFKSLKFLKEKFEGYNFYTQRNNYNDKVYILLPIINDDIKLEKKEFNFNIGQGLDGTPDPYIVCKIPDFQGDVKIALLFDVHYGNFAHKKEKFLSYLNWIKETPNVYAILGGDLMEDALDDGRGMTYDQTENPHTQFDDMVKLLAPISHKILCATTGNHEHRIYKKTGIDITKLLCEKLKIPYFSGAIWLTILANTYKWNLWVSHGYSSSRTKGGKMNSANRPKSFTGLIHFFISGHVHDRVCESETLLTDDPINCRLMELKQWTIVAPSFLGWKETYAYRAGYPPPASGGVSVELLDNGDYRGSLT